MFKQKKHTARHGALILAGASLALSACGPELSRVSEIETLRIMGVRKSAPYARPGETVSLHMLWEDGAEQMPEQVESFFGFWCLNPPGDVYSSCLTSPPNVNPPQFVTNQSNFELVIPENSTRSSSVEPNAPDSGTAFVFYGICAGTLDLGVSAPDADDGDSAASSPLPRCLDEDGNELGPDDFVIGYSKIFIYDDLRNENPIVTGFKVNGQDVQIDCIDEDCDGPFPVPELTGCTDGVACFKACEDDGDLLKCPATSIEAVIDPASAEQDELAFVTYGQELEEAIWVSYFVDQGTVSPELKMVNDATLGWQSDYSSEFFAPSEAGPLRLWAVVRDNRGGSAWIRVPAFIEAD